MYWIIRTVLGSPHSRAKQSSHDYYWPAACTNETLVPEEAAAGWAFDGFVTPKRFPCARKSFNCIHAESRSIDSPTTRKSYEKFMKLAATRRKI